MPRIPLKSDPFAFDDTLPPTWITLLSERNPASSGTEFLFLGIGGTR